MPRLWNLEELIDELKFIYNFNSGQTDQDMRGTATDPDKRFRDAINEAYVDEVEEAVQMGDTVYFIQQRFLAWPASQPTLDVGEDIANATLYRLEYRDANAGAGAAWELMWLSAWTEDVNHYWLDRRTLQWGLSGPSSEQTVRVILVGEPEELKDASDEPTLIPRKFRHLLPYAAAIKLRMIADDETNSPLVRKRNELRERFHKALSQGRPAQTGYPGATTATPDVYGLIP